MRASRRRRPTSPPSSCCWSSSLLNFVVDADRAAGGAEHGRGDAAREPASTRARRDPRRRRPRCAASSSTASRPWCSRRRATAPAAARVGASASPPRCAGREPSSRAEGRADADRGGLDRLRREARRQRGHAARSPGRGAGADRPLGLRQDDAAALAQPAGRDHADGDPRRPHHARRRGHRPDGGDGAAAPGQHGLPAAQPVPDERLRQRRLRAARAGLGPARQGRADELRRRRAAARRALGRGRGDPRPPGAAPLRRPAAAALHRPRARRPARGAAARRALLGARPALDPGDRGADPATCATRSRS